MSLYPKKVTRQQTGIVERAITEGSVIKKRKKIRVITLQGAIDKSPKLLS